MKKQKKNKLMLVMLHHPMGEAFDLYKSNNGLVELFSNNPNKTRGLF
jgi:hypothetical protein